MIDIQLRGLKTWIVGAPVQPFIRIHWPCPASLLDSQREKSKRFGFVKLFYLRMFEFLEPGLWKKTVVEEDMGVSED